MKRLPILMYHNIEKLPHGGHPDMYIEPQVFDKQMRRLARLGYTGLGIEKAMAMCNSRRKIIAVTFDDAYQDNFNNALPVLIKYGFSATCFAVTSLIGKTNEWGARGVPKRTLMSASDMREWVSNGMEVGAHGRTHRKLSQLTTNELVNEVRGSKEDLEDLLQAETRWFAYPFGNYDLKSREAVKDAGFNGAVTASMRRSNGPVDMYALPRIPVAARSSLFLRLAANTIPDFIFVRLFPKRKSDL